MKLGSFRISGVWGGRLRGEIGFVSHFLAAGKVCLIGIAFGDRVLAGPSALGRCALLRSPSLGMTHGGVNWVRFVFFGVGGAGVGINWVRFAETGGGGTLGMLKLGSFRIFGIVGVSPTSVGVKYRGGRPAACVVFRVRFT